MGKCSDPTGDKENLTNKATQLTVLHSELPEGQAKLEKALAVAAQACQIADSEDKEIIEEEVALLQEELDIYLESLTRIKQLVEAGIVRWNEYEDQYKEACDWLAQTETLVKGKIEKQMHFVRKIIFFNSNELFNSLKNKFFFFRI